MNSPFGQETLTFILELSLWCKRPPTGSMTSCSRSVGVILTLNCLLLARCMSNICITTRGKTQKNTLRCMHALGGTQTIRSNHQLHAKRALTFRNKSFTNFNAFSIIVRSSRALFSSSPSSANGGSLFMLVFTKLVAAIAAATGLRTS